MIPFSMYKRAKLKKSSIQTRIFSFRSELTFKQFIRVGLKMNIDVGSIALHTSEIRK